LPGLQFGLVLEQTIQDVRGIVERTRDHDAMEAGELIAGEIVVGHSTLHMEVLSHGVKTRFVEYLDGLSFLVSVFPTAGEGVLEIGAQLYRPKSRTDCKAALRIFSQYSETRRIGCLCNQMKGENFRGLHNTREQSQEVQT
jgi:hypothetical protein